MADLFGFKKLTKLEVQALQEFKAARAAGQPWGRKRIVSMQACEEAGYVVRVSRDGLISDWELTDAGRAWKPPAGQ